MLVPIVPACLSSVNALPKPLETLYAGQRYRSRLEARYGVFFERLNLPFQYEPEAFDLGRGMKYMPDFWLPSVRLRTLPAGCYIEIKPNREGVYANDRRFERFATEVGPLVAFPGAPMDVEGYQFLLEGRFGLWWDEGMIWTRCYSCNRVAILHNPGECPHCGEPADDTEPGLVAAAECSRRFRFDWK